MAFSEGMLSYLSMLATLERLCSRVLALVADGFCKDSVDGYAAAEELYLFKGEPPEVPPCA